MKFIHTLNTIKNNLQEHHRTREELLPLYIQERLSKSLEVYSNDLDKSLSYLYKGNELNMMKRLNRVK